MPRCRRKHQSWEPYTTSSTDWLERESPDSTMPANRIQAGPFPAGPFPGAPFPDDAWWRARRTYSATDIPKARASRLARSYSRSSRLICVRIMSSPDVSHDTQGLPSGSPGCPRSSARQWNRPGQTAQERDESTPENQLVSILKMRKKETTQIRLSPENGRGQPDLRSVVFFSHCLFVNTPSISD